MKEANRLKIDVWRESIDHRMLAWIDRQEPASLYEPMRYAVTAGGKKLRPLLLLLFGEAVGSDPETLFDAAAAIELVHDFSLVHDDIMDHDTLRRGRPTVHAQWDESIAILAGDCLLVHAFRVLSSVPSPHSLAAVQRFAEDIIGVCEGQAYDKAFENRDEVAIHEYANMIGLKTGRLFALCCELGALLGQGTPEEQKQARQYGLQLGFAFQVQDDLLDLVGKQEILGKEVGSDLKEGKKTFLILHALENGTPELRRQLHAFLHQTNLSEQDIRLVIDLLNETGTLQQTRKVIADALMKARTALEVFRLTPAREVLSEVLELVEERQA